MPIFSAASLKEIMGFDNLCEKVIETKTIKIKVHIRIIVKISCNLATGSVINDSGMTTATL